MQDEDGIYCSWPSFTLHTDGWFSTELFLWNGKEKKVVEVVNENENRFRQ
jgi:hypothetical protein